MILTGVLSKMAPLLGYWDIRGLAQPIRMLLNYVEEEFEDKKYVCGPGFRVWTVASDATFEIGPEFDRECWFKEKFALGLDFPNLPYYIDEDIRITQSSAILRHIARKHNLCGETTKEKAMVDMLENELADFKCGISGLVYNPDNYEENKKNYMANVPDVIKQFADVLGERKFLLGDKITFVDFVMYELVDHHKAFEPCLLEPHKNLKEFLERVEALPTITKYMKSDKFIARPFNNPMAMFQ